MSRAIPKDRARWPGQAFVQRKSIPASDHRMYPAKYGSAESRRCYQQFLTRTAGGCYPAGRS